MRNFAQRIVDRLFRPVAPAPPPPAAAAPPPAESPSGETLILARDLVRLRRRVGIVESLAPGRVEEVRRIAVDAAVSVRALRVEIEAEATQASARFAYVRQEVARYREEAARASELLSENAERAGDGVHAFRDAAASTLASYEERVAVVLDTLRARVDELAALRARVDELDALRPRIDALEAAQIEPEAGGALDALRARVDELAGLGAGANEIDALQMRIERAEARVATWIATSEAKFAELDDLPGAAETRIAALAAPVEESLAGIRSRVEALELISFPLPGASSSRSDRVDRIEKDAARALEGVEQLRRTLTWQPDFAVPAFDGAVAGNGALGKPALVERFRQTFLVGDDEEREAAASVVESFDRVLVIAEDDRGSNDEFTRVAPDDHAVAQTLADAGRGTYGAIVALAYPERCAVEQRFAFLRAAAQALTDEGTLVLGITNGYAPEAWRRFHLDPWNTHPWMPDTWRFALATAGFRGARFYDPMRREYVSDVVAAGARLLALGYR